ncbi:hypothetical protein [Planktothricoides raciborskii]|uniref:Uncharacterized protein n=1 Tax=Planktothricoides raciborskii FACHB-1370 TaxID=2949576 RepID=A0ABR8EHP0_9CYAN|nr:hypothetical protein [Planktothricoides raciborskii]MBD2545265.1 hypothetical protein [Planktothricoides raciborskii FACHB-1370]MBD2584418.1 hypothetical protein [Planktothricoides raciborskii FACHB-1261]
MGSEKETRFLLLGQRNRVSSVGIRSYLWQRERNPVSGVLGVAVGAKKPGFCCQYHELSVRSEKETRFLGAADY